MARKGADERRQELVSIGLRLLVDTPIHELSLDQVASEAGISRGLLFHYFATKTDYYAAVTDAAVWRILSQARDPEVGAPRDRQAAILGGYVRFIRRRKRNYVALVRGAAGGDGHVLDAVRRLRSELTERVLVAGGMGDASAKQVLYLRGWLAMAEELAIEGTDATLPVDDLIAELIDALPAVLGMVDHA